MGLINKINVGGTDYDIASSINVSTTMNAETGGFNPISAEDLEKLTTSLTQGVSNIFFTVTTGDMSMSVSLQYISKTDTQYIFRQDQVSWDDESIAIALTPQLYGINMTTGVVSIYVSGTTTIDCAKMGR